jgi:RNA polymerase sigma-70 factor (ECF subfamily)
MKNPIHFLSNLFQPADAVAFDQFYREHLPPVYNFFRYRFTDETLAEDLTAMTFEKAWKNRYRYRHNLSAFSTWLFTIAKRIAIDAYRRKTPDEMPLDALENTIVAISVEEHIQTRSDLQQLRSLLCELTERERELIALKYGAGLNNREIARLSGLSESNTGVILFRAVQQLREKWEQANE